MYQNAVNAPERKVLLPIIIKWILALLCICFTMYVNAQTTPVKTPADLSNANDPTKGTSTNDGSALFCAKAASFTLSASKTDPANAAIAYKKWEWKEVDPSGSPAALDATAAAAAEKLTVTNAVPGWHTYVVTASAGDAACPADPVYFTVFVLPDLKAKASIDATVPSLTYCAANGAPTDPAKAIIMKGAVEFDGTLRSIAGLPTLAVSDFEFKYTWYRIDQSNNRSSVYTGTTANYTVTDPANTSATTEQKYSYELEVVYSVVPKKGACDAVKAGVTYNSSPAVITVTPKPGKPTITIQ